MIFYLPKRKGLSALLGILLLACGCKPDAAVHTGKVVDGGLENPPQPGAVAQSVTNNTNVDSTQLGTVSGTVLFRGTPPPRVRIDMSADPGCAFAENQTEQVEVNGGKLANVYLFIKGAKPSQAPAGQPPVIMDQRGCRFVPHVLAVQQGGYVQFNNSDRTKHSVHITTAVGDTAVPDVTEDPGAQPQSRQFSAPGTMLAVRCGPHPWMSAFVDVADSPYFAVTGPDGRFVIHGLPPGRYTLAAVQEKLGEQDIPVTILPHATAKLTVAFRQ